MASEVNIAEFATVPHASIGVGSPAAGMVQMPGDLIRARDVAVDGSASYELQSTTRYVIVFCYGPSAVYVAASADAGALEQGHGQPMAAGMGLPLTTNKTKRFVRLTERVEG